MTKPVILTGIRANNDLHIGNYFGAMLPMIDMAKQCSADYDINMFIPDLHSFTTPIDHSQLYESIMNNARVYTAAGLPLDNDSIHLYRQSHVPAHSELTIILNSFSSYGYLQRMTQFKDKSGIQDIKTRLLDYIENWTTVSNEKFEKSKEKNFTPEEQCLDFKKTIENEVLSFLDKLRNDLERANSVSVGLFDYPVLMAADILLYNAKYIPVGDDQTQHIEFTRDLAEHINAKFGELFIVPEPVAKQHEFFGKEQGLRIKDLVDPIKKMSKSDETGKGVIFLSDSPDVARKKIMSATTDDKARVAYDKTNQPGISNLLEILTLARQANGQNTTLQQVCDEFTGMERYGDFKNIVADEVTKFLADFQARLANVDDTQILAKLESSERAMNEVANATLLRVQKAIGLRK